MSIPNDRKYLSTHEWHKAEGNVVTIGITQFAADELTDVTYVQLPRVGATLQAGGSFGEIESVKTASDLNCGVSGTVVAVNEALTNDPGLVNRDPFGQGWMIKVQVSDLNELNALLAPADYLKNAGH
ncbi:MAG: glycine cleavage system protein GcvH [Phycisphaerales bacterium]|nr:glycine cleavage system protein GcvH [Phycisphaerales bacterium]